MKTTSRIRMQKDFTQRREGATVDSGEAKMSAIGDSANSRLLFFAP
jgi:hypothetical protein